MVPSIGFEPMTFPMSRERATPAPTGLKGNALPLRQLGLNQFECLFIIAYLFYREKKLVGAVLFVLLFNEMKIIGTWAGCFNGT